MNRNDPNNAMETEFVGGPWARRAWLGGCLVLACVLLVRAVPGSPLHPQSTTAQVTPTGPSPSQRAGALGTQPASTAEPEVRQVGRFLVLSTNIEDITDQDVVLAKDPETDELAAKPVVQTFRRTSDHLRILRIRNADGTTQTIETTDEHPFWVPTRGWVNAGELAPGDPLTQSDGHLATVVSARRDEHPEDVPVYNFEVADLHTYFVAASPRAPPVLVHNANCRLPPVVIGEGMGRVRAYAKKIGGEVFELSGHFPDDELKALNKSWIRGMMDQGRTIIDIGPNPAKAGAISKFYAMELDEVLSWGYRWRIPVTP